MTQSLRDRIARLEEALVAVQDEVSPVTRNFITRVVNEETTPGAPDMEPLFDAGEGQVSISDIEIVPLLDVQVTHTRHLDEIAVANYLEVHKPGMPSWQNLSAKARKVYLDAAMYDRDLSDTLKQIGYKIGSEARTHRERAAVSMGLAAGMKARREQITGSD